MGKLQSIFNTVIDTGFYTNRETIGSSLYMCNSLRYALMYNRITEDEHGYAINKISKYMNKLVPLTDIKNPLKECLRRNDLPCTFEDTLSIYKDWKNRPKPWETINLWVRFTYQE